MQQKQIYLIFLIFGISTLFFTCDKGEVEYFLNTDYEYVNKTSNTISFSIWPPTNSGEKKITLLPNSTSETINYKASGSFENPTPDNCCQGLLDDLLGGGEKGITVKIDSIYCSLKSITDIENYKSEVIADRHYKYTFTFTDKVLEDKKDCRIAY